MLYRAGEVAISYYNMGPLVVINIGGGGGGGVSAAYDESNFLYQSANCIFFWRYNTSLYGSYHQS